MREVLKENQNELNMRMHQSRMVNNQTQAQSNLEYVDPRYRNMYNGSHFISVQESALGNMNVQNIPESL